MNFFRINLENRLMATGLVSTVSTDTTGSIASVGASLTKLGSTTKAFLVTHPTVVGFALGVTTICVLNHMISKRRKNKAIAALRTA